MKKLSLLIVGLFYVSSYAQLTPTENYIFTKIYLNYDLNKIPIKTRESVTYFDGLGRPKQSVAIKASPRKNDLVTTIPYDSFGRQVDSYLPVSMTSTNGGIHSLDSTGVVSYYNAPQNGTTKDFPILDTRPFSHMVLENSPLDRIQQQIQVGSEWQNRPVSFGYQTNEQNEVYKYVTTTSWSNNATLSVLTLAQATDTNSFNHYYKASQLYKNTVTDEDGSTTIEFKNGQGQTLLLRKNDGVKNADTYYVYNEYNQLAYVIPPLAVGSLFPDTTLSADNTYLNDLCYQYRYDGRARLVEKKLPGKGWEFMVYDKQDRLVLNQDANLRLTTNNFKAKGWLFTKYDKFGRVVYTGFFKNGATRNVMQTALNNMQANATNNELRTTAITFTSQGMPVYYNNEGFPTGAKVLLSVNYYDSYPTGTPYPSGNTIQGEPILEGFLPAGVTQSTQSLSTAYFVKNIEDDNWTQNYSFYDRKGRVIGGHSINHLGGETRTESILDFIGIPQKTFTYHSRQSSRTPTVAIEETFTYDAQNRLLKHEHQVNNQLPEILAENTYNEIGQLAKKRVGNNIQEIDYAYNIRGWMTKINDPSNLGIKLFGYKIKYNNVDGLQVPNTDFSDDKVLPKYDGNIAEIDWATANDGILRRYGYVYDGVSRLRAGFYQSSQNPSAKEYFERLLYDNNGNITELKRSSSVMTGNPFATLIDNLTYSYRGNQLQTISDTQQNSDGYPYTAIPKRITYDPNGNMTSMSDKGISSINYNHLNLPTKLDLVESDTSTTIKYTYSADGLKKNKIVSIICPTCRFDPKITNYLDGFQYEDEVLQFMPTTAGYYDFIKNAYIYNYTDHLGNVRLSYYKNRAGVLTIDTESNYYPFGLKHEGYNENQSTATFNYKYNGKELQETGMYDYGARMYMPDIGRWGVVDPLAEMYRRYSPYNYTVNNPINFTDPDGRWVKGAGFWNNITKSDSRIHAEQWAEKLGSGNYNVSVNKGSNGSWTVSSHSLIASTKETFDSKGLKNTLYVPYSEGGGLGTAPSYGDPWGTTIGSIPESRGKTQMQTMVAENPLVQDAIIGAVTAGVINKGVLQASEGLSRVLNVNKQARHLLGTAKEGGGFVNSMDDAHAVLNAVHLGEATYLGTSKAGYQVYRFGGVTGTNVNIGAGIIAQPTNVFMIKGTINPSIVPTTPLWTP